MYVQKLHIKNFKGIQTQDSDIQGSNVLLIGPNASGKSSYIDAVWSALTGKNMPERTVTDGKSEGEIEVDLGEFTARLDLSDGKKPNFKLFSKDGKPVSKPRETMNSMVGIIDFDPQDFFAMSAAKQVEYFCKHVIDVDFKALDTEYAELYENRTHSNAQLRIAKTNLQPYEKEYVDREPVDVIALTNKINGAAKIAEDRERVAIGLSKTEIEIAELQEKITQLQEKVSQGKEWIKNNPEIVLNGEQRELDQAAEVNMKIQHAKEQAVNEQTIEDAAADVQATELAMKAINDQKKEVIEGAINIPGLTFNGTQFLLEGLPFAETQINTASQIMAGLQMAAHMLDKVRIMRFEGSLIDNSNMEEIKAWAAREGIQLFVEIMERSGDGLVVQIEEEV